MTNTIVQMVEKWYADNSKALSSTWSTLRMRSKDSGIAKGKVVIEFENAQVLGTVTLWNTGDVTTLAVEKRSGTEHTLADRRLTPTESISSLLSDHFRQLADIASSPNE